MSDRTSEKKIIQFLKLHLIFGPYLVVFGFILLLSPLIFGVNRVSYDFICDLEIVSILLILFGITVTWINRNKVKFELRLTSSLLELYQQNINELDFQGKDRTDPIAVYHYAIKDKDKKCENAEQIALILEERGINVSREKIDEYYATRSRISEIYHGASRNLNMSSSNDASVIGRAVVGAVIAGSAGAIVGAISAADKNANNRANK